MEVAREIRDLTGTPERLFMLFARRYLQHLAADLRRWSDAAKCFREVSDWLRAKRCYHNAEQWSHAAACARLLGHAAWQHLYRARANPGNAESILRDMYDTGLALSDEHIAFLETAGFDVSPGHPMSGRHTASDTRSALFLLYPSAYS